MSLMKASSSSLGAQRPVVSASRVARSVVARAADNLQRPELKRPEEAAAPAAPAPAPASPAPTAPSASSAPAPGSGPTIEYQRTRAKAMRSYFQQLKVNEQIKQSQVFGWTKSNEISNGRWVMFGLLVGMMTEYATGYSFPDQIALLLSYLGITDS